MDVQREDVRWEGYADRACGDHRTTGGRAWCFSCSSWCYESMPCPGCEAPLVRGMVATLIAAVSDDFSPTQSRGKRTWDAIRRINAYFDGESFDIEAPPHIGRQFQDGES